jgi:anaerobic selenocysteine-containing dehydrogenase
VAGAAYTFGWFPAFDPKPDTGLLLLWGNNQIHFMGGFIREEMRSAILGGAKLVVIDPKRIDIAKRANIWISPRPNSDGVLAMGMIKVLIEEELYDKDFVSNWTIGFDRLKEHIKSFSLDDVERLTWVSKSQIADTVKLLVKCKPVSFAVGNGIERTIHAFQQLRAIFILRALLGGLNTPGGNVRLTPGNFLRPGIFYNLKGSPRLEKIKAKQVVGSEFPIAMSNAYVPTQSLMRSILTEDPNPIKAVLCILTNPVISYPDTEQTRKALMKLDLLVVSEIFPTPTTELADIVLPAAWGAEHDTLGYWPGWHEEMRAYPKLVDPPGEARADTDWINELGIRLGFRDSFWEKEEDALNLMLEPSGLTWEEFKDKRSLDNKKEYKKPEEKLFDTPSGKVEIYSQSLAKRGSSPMPLFNELSVFRYDVSDEYPLMLFNGKEAAYMLTGYKHVKFMRDRRPEPTVDLHPKLAEKLGVKEDDWVYIETKKGRVKQKLRLDPDLDPRLVYVSFGWWFPEEPNDLFEHRRSNINVLLESDPPHDPDTGSVEMGGIPCRVYKA